MEVAVIALTLSGLLESGKAAQWPLLLQQGPMISGLVDLFHLAPEDVEYLLF